MSQSQRLFRCSCYISIFPSNIVDAKQRWFGPVAPTGWARQFYRQLHGLSSKFPCLPAQGNHGMSHSKHLSGCWSSWISATCYNNVLRDVSLLCKTPQSIQKCRLLRAFGGPHVRWAKGPWSIRVEHAACPKKFTVSLAFWRDSVRHLQFNTNPQACPKLLTSSLAVSKARTCTRGVTKSWIVWIIMIYYDIFMQASAGMISCHPPHQWNDGRLEMPFSNRTAITQQCAHIYTHTHTRVIRCSWLILTRSGIWLILIAWVRSQFPQERTHKRTLWLMTYITVSRAPGGWSHVRYPQSS